MTFFFSFKGEKGMRLLKSCDGNYGVITEKICSFRDRNLVFRTEPHVERRLSKFDSFNLAISRCRKLTWRDTLQFKWVSARTLKSMRRHRHGIQMPNLNMETLIQTMFVFKITFNIIQMPNLNMETLIQTMFVFKITFNIKHNGKQTISYFEEMHLW